MNNNPIGIIDSGVGGLSVWQEIKTLLPEESTIYVADTKNLPYGDKSEEEVSTLSNRLMRFLIDKDVLLIVIACNTITVSALEQFRKSYPSLPIVGTVPVVKTAASLSQNKRIGILSTIRTAESEYQKKLIAQFASDCEVINIGTNKLVPMIERGEVDMAVLTEELQPFVNAKIDVLALGCTHFPFLKKEMQTILGSGVHIVDSGKAIARQVKRILQQESIESDAVLGNHAFYTTGEITMFEKQVERLVGEKHGKIKEAVI
jgi:glutamate racemase